MTGYTEEQEKVFGTVAYLGKAAAVIQDQTQEIRLKYQEEYNISGNDFYRELGAYLKATIGRCYI